MCANHKPSKRFVVSFLLAAGITIILCAMQGCGDHQKSVYKTVKVPDGAVGVQLNSDWNVVFPSDTYTTTEVRSFKPPSAVYAVQGIALCWDGMSFNPCLGPEKTLRARLYIGTNQCEYRADNTNTHVLSLIDCYGISRDNTTLVPSGTKFELDNYDAPGQLLEVQFFLTR